MKWQNTQTISVNTGAMQGTTYFNAWTALRNSGFYSLFAQMYDQIKLNAVHVKITLLSASTAIYSATNNPVFCSAWDRNGISITQNGTLTYQTIGSYGSAITRPLTQGANFGVSRSIYASSMNEKSQYVPTSHLPIYIRDETESSTDEYSLHPFKPILLLGIYSSSTQSSAQSLTFNIEWSFDVTFRGTRNDPNAIEA